MIADKLKELRARKGLTREAAAEKIGISARTLANYERGERIPQGEILGSIADFYGISREELLLDCLREKEFPETIPSRKDDPLTPHTEEQISAAHAPSEKVIGENSPTQLPDEEKTDEQADTKSAKKRKMRAWVIAGSILIAFLLFDLTLFFIENLPVENGDSALGIVFDWRNLGIAFLILLLLLVTAFGIFLLVHTRKEKPRRLFVFAVCLSLAGMVAAGSLSALLCKDAFFAPKEARRGFATYVRLDLQGDYQGNVTAQVTNNFTFGFDVVPVRIDLYFSESYTENTEEMALVQTVSADNLPIFERIRVSAAGQDGYWRAQAVYKTNGSGWQELQTDTLHFDARGVKV